MMPQVFYRTVFAMKDTKKRLTRPTARLNDSVGQEFSRSGLPDRPRVAEAFYEIRSF